MRWVVVFLLFSACKKDYIIDEPLILTREEKNCIIQNMVPETKNIDEKEKKYKYFKINGKYYRSDDPKLRKCLKYLLPQKLTH